YLPQQVQSATQAFVRAGLLADALELLSTAADMPANVQRGVSGDVLATLGASFARQFAARPAKERFDLLKPWTMPTEGRKSVRVLSTLVPIDAPPAAFGPVVVTPDGVLNTASLLI